MSAPQHATPAVLSAAAHHHRLTDTHRLQAVRRCDLLDGASSVVLDRLTRIASTLLAVPVSAVTLVDDVGQHFGGLHGLGGWAGERRGTPLSHSFCQHVVALDAPLVIEDARLDERVADSLAIPVLAIIAYAAVPLRTADGQTVGAFCAIDRVPRTWSAENLRVLEDLAAAAMAEIELRSRVRALTAAESRLRAEVTRDEVTGLLNRRGLAEAAPQYLARARRTSAPFSVVVLDIDEFKAINEQCGSDEGSRVLTRFARELASCARESDLVARLGGDEFLVLLEGADAGAAEAFIGRLRISLPELHASDDLAGTLSVSVGTATWSWTQSPEPTLGHLIDRAEHALFHDRSARAMRQEPG